MNRREFALTPLAITTACSQPAQKAAWPARWDRALIDRAIKSRSLRFDDDKQMIRVILGPEYRYHTSCAMPGASTRDHLIRFYRWRRRPAGIERLQDPGPRRPAQVTDPGSKWYGIWGWCLQNRPARWPAD